MLLCRKCEPGFMAVIVQKDFPFLAFPHVSHGYEGEGLFIERLTYMYAPVQIQYKRLHH